VYNPYKAGILESACIKPAHVGGSLSSTPYEEVLSLLMDENPDIQTIGTIFNSAEAAGVVGVAEIKRIAEAQGLEVIEAAVADISDISLAAEGLISKGIDAFVMPIDLRTGAAGLPIVVNLGNEYGIPVFHPILFSIYYGATVSSGFYHYYAQGENVGVLLAAHLNGDIDIATTAINEQTGNAIGINLDMAGRQEIEISQELIDQADAVIRNGEAMISDRVGAELRMQGEIMSMEDRMMGDQEFLANLHCSPERIAEEQAALDAMES
ncbi:MAG: ABC transporter substrate binding protein, partial [Chloroflexi bacterium]|nr:ABC transporter substrate binding protein [Chloroflexota bacterium]